MDSADTQLLWGFIPLDPSGEISIWNFLMEHKDIEDARMRAHSHYVQAFMTVVLLVIFIRNTYYAALLIYTKPRSVASWCCFFQALMGTISGILNMTTGLPGGFSCRICNWVYSLGITISSICVSLCLLIRAYIITNKSAFLLFAGILLIIPLPATVWIFWVKSISKNTVDAACVSIFPSYLPWFRLGLDVSINTVFSAIFLDVVIQQYRTIGNKCWKRLQSDGIIYLLGVTVSNISCALIVAFQFIGGFSEMMFLVDWMVTSTLLIHQHRGMQKAFNTYHHLNHRKSN
ncbi:hypothetical protein BDF19DRAFT_420367 [Syncephalis fuscata]|nr:hypothetical protein BDF19DRAFT_420367 [Syncephalis fuscata]